MEKMIATKSFRYATRRLQAGDQFDAKPGHARLLIAVKRAMPARDSLPPPPASLARKVRETARPIDPPKIEIAKSDPSADLVAVREEYQVKLGKRPFFGWGVEELRRRISEVE